MSPVLFLLAGPNGAGKSTLYERRVRPLTAAPFINADVIQRDELRAPSPSAAYEAARLADARRDDFLRDGRSFVTETVFSHPSKLDLVRQAKAHGFQVFLFHVGVETPELAVARVGERVGEGGHDVPETKIRERFARNGPLIREAMLLADRGAVYDNSRLNVPPEQIITFRNGRPVTIAATIPGWARRIYGADLAMASPR